jgi:elongation factor Ts
MAKITMELIQQLRDRTGVGMMDCKNALNESGGDLEKAIEILRKKGAAIAAKRSSNITVEGLVHAYIHPGSRVGVLLEVDCETDFVARTDALKQFAADVCLHIAAMRPLYVSPEEVDSQLLNKERAIFKEQLAASGKPEKIIDQIVEGKITKYYTEICLLQQPFVKNDKVTVDDVLKDLIAKLGENIKIRRFARFEVGS